MECKLFAKTVFASLYIGVLLGSAQAIADCMPVKGKIVNSSSVPPGGVIIGDDVSTAGVVAFAKNSSYGNLKCGIVGVVNPDAPGEPPLPGFPPLSSFTHLISCDDSVPVYDLGAVHSQLTLDTSGKFTDYDGVCTFSFIEQSEPHNDELENSSGKGVFAGITSGKLMINGTVNFCVGAIDMKFEGEFCN